MQKLNADFATQLIEGTRAVFGKLAEDIHKFKDHRSKEMEQISARFTKRRRTAESGGGRGEEVGGRRGEGARGRRGPPRKKGEGRFEHMHHCTLHKKDLFAGFHFKRSTDLAGFYFRLRSSTTWPTRSLAGATSGYRASSTVKQERGEMVRQNYRSNF